MSKTGKKHSKPLRNGFHDQGPKRMCFWFVCLPNSCQNAFNHSKLAHKRPKPSNIITQVNFAQKSPTRPNSTKIWKRSKTSKTDKLNTTQKWFLGRKRRQKYFATITSTKVFHKRFKFFYFGNKRAIRSKIKKNRRRSKTNEKHWKPLRIAFHDQRPNRMWWQIVCLPNLCQNASNHSKLAHKRPKRSNSTKIEMRLKTSKTATECLKPLGKSFLWPNTKTNSSFRKNFFFDQSRAKTPQIKLNLLRND